MAIPCSQLHKTLTDLAMLIASQPGFDTLDKVTAEMQKVVDPAITRTILADAITAASTGTQKAMDDAAATLAEIRREARTDSSLRAKIADATKALASDPTPKETVKPAKAAPEAIVKLREELGALREAISEREKGSDKEQALRSISKRIGAGVDIADLKGGVRSLARALVEEGIEGRTELVDEIHKLIEPEVPGLTKRMVQDLISGYGDYRTLTGDAVDAKLRDLKGQLQQVSKLQDMQEKHQLPLRTGSERRIPSEEERHLIQQVNDTKKSLGLAAVDPAVQLKSTLDTIKTRLRNQIADLQQEIITHKRRERIKKKPPSDAESIALQQKRDELKKKYVETFGENTGAIEARIEELQKHLADGTVPPPVTRKQVPVSERVATLRAVRDQLRKSIQTSEPAARKRVEAQIKRLTDIADAIDAGEYVPPEPKGKPDPLSHEIDKAMYQRDRLRAAVQHHIESMRPKSAFEKAKQLAYEPIQASRSLMTSMDISATARQGGFINFGNPDLAAKMIGVQLKSFADPVFAHKVNQEVMNLPHAPILHRAGLYLAPDLDAPATAREEAFMSRWAEKVPGVKQSERAYNTGLNYIRGTRANAMIEGLARNGSVTLDEARVIANYVNVATGRGNLYQMETAAQGLAQIFFSPRYWASRIELATGQPLWAGKWQGTGRARLAVAKEYAKFMLGMTAFVGLGVLAGGVLGLDPRSTDFLKLKFGDMRIDPFMGISQNLVLASRLYSGKTVNQEGKTSDLSGPGHKYGSTDQGDLILRFIRSKLAPGPAAAINLITRKDMQGQPTSIPGEIKRMVVPMPFSDVYDAIKSDGVTGGVAAGLAALLGLGVQTYSNDAPTPAEKMQKRIDAKMERIKQLQGN